MIKSYKLKTKQAMAKRFKINGNNLIQSKMGGIRHRLTSKSSNKNRSKFKIIHSSDFSRITKYIRSFLK